MLLEKESRKKPFFFAALAILLYLAVGSQPLQKELVFKPVWATRIDAVFPAEISRSIETGEKLIPFRSGSLFGYLTESGFLFRTGAVEYGLAQSSTAYVLYSKNSDAFRIMTPAGVGGREFRIPGYPFFAGKRRFVMRPDQSGVVELDNAGGILWNQDFPSIITCFSASPSLTVFGLLDGRVIGIDDKGLIALDFSPGGSRIAAIYGVAVSADATMIAIVSGLDRQRFSLLEKRGKDYQTSYHAWFSSDLRRPVSVVFSGKGRAVFYERSGGIGVFNTDMKESGFIAAGRILADGRSVNTADAGFFVTEDARMKRLVGLGAKGQKILTAPFKAEHASLFSQGSALYLTADSTAMRIDVEER